MPMGERRLLEPAELWPQEVQLCVKSAEGGLLDLRSRQPGEDNPVQGRMWGAHRKIRAQVLFQLLTGDGPKLAERVVAVRLRGAQVVGRLNLGGATLRCPLELNQCYLRHRLDLAKANIPNLSLRGSYLHSRLSGRQLQVAHTLNLSRRFHCNSGAVFKQAHIGGELDCSEAVFANRGGYALNANRLTADGGVFLRKAQCTGEIRLQGAHIGGQLVCTEAVFANPDGNALSADGLTVDGGVFLRKAQCTGEVGLPGADIRGVLACDEAVLTNPGGNALRADGLTVDGGVFLRKAQCTGEVRLPGADIKGVLACNEAVLTNPDGNALRAEGLTVGGGVFLSKARCTGEVGLLGADIKGALACNEARCIGEVGLLGAHVGGQLICDEAVFTNLSGPSLIADDLTADGVMSLRKAQCTGEVRLLGAHVGGQLICDEAVFTNPSGHSLNANRLTADDGMSLRKTQCTGEVRLLGAHIEGALDCTEATFVNPDGDALNAARLTLDGAMFLQKAQCTGEVQLSAAHIGGQLVCNEATFVNPNGKAVSLQSTSVVGDVLMYPDSLEGGLDLTRTQVGAWLDAKKTWPQSITLDGFVYSSIHAPDATIEDRLRSWLPRNSYRPQPYEQLAGVYRREGNEQAARVVTIGKQRARRADHARWWIRWPSVAWSAVLRWSIGYGYRPALALIPLLLLIETGSLLFLTASEHPELLYPAKPGSPEQPSFNSFRYTMDLLLPVVNFKQRDSFVVEGWAAWASFGFTFAGWLLAAIVVAGLAGVFKRD
jgi:hypothetical protein